MKNERGGDQEALDRRDAVVASLDTMLSDDSAEHPTAAVANRKRGRPSTGKYGKRPPRKGEAPTEEPQGPTPQAGTIGIVVMGEQGQVIRGTVERVSDLDERADAARKDLVMAQATNGIAYDPNIGLADPLLPMVSSRRVGMGLVFKGGITFEEWARDVQRLLMAERVVPWLIADALAYGEDVFNEQWSQVLEASVYAYQTLVNMAYVARKIPNARRRPTVPFAVHAAVAGLDVGEQERLLKQAEEEGITREEMRVEVRKSKIEAARRKAEKMPDPGDLPMDGVILWEASALDTGIADGNIDCIFTSPPYGLDGNEKGDKYRVADDADTWGKLMDGFLEEAMRVLAENGRLIVNLPIDTTVGGYRPVSAIFTMLAIAHGFRYVTTIAWHDTQLGKSVARGSIDSPAAVRVTTPQEHILVFSKGEYGRSSEDKRTDLLHEEWVEWTNGYWQVPGESDGYEGFQAAMPTELARRAIKLFTFMEDVILDPFLGSGTTALVAWRHQRVVYGCDIDAVQVASSKRRLRAAALGPEA